ncbi:phosphotransferase [Nonomuraea sp. NPDC059194]|uniref:phosphotransferase n=1 Tax=Nonomuraea sp. NPDC059194 TaxID=3346764 RepID=UPI0036855691
MDLEDELSRMAGEYGGAGAPTRHQTRSDVVVVRRGEVVVKAHSARDEQAPLRLRLKASASAAMTGVLLPPLHPEVQTVCGRSVTVWPAGTPVAPDDPDGAPWEEGARLLARLHAVPQTAVPPLPEAGGPERMARAVMSMPGDGAAQRLVRQAFAALPEPEPVPRLLTHGDWHLGQLVQRSDRWLLIDVDDLGIGDPAWDLARPAAWFAAGLLDPQIWGRFLNAYLASGGPALDPQDPWARLDIPARAVTVQIAAVAVGHAHRENRELDEVEQSLIQSCGRIVGLK